MNEQQGTTELQRRQAAYREQVARDQAARDANRLLDVTHPRCAACRERKQRSDFHQDTFSATGVRAQCKECWNGVRRARAAAARDFAASAGGTP